jgi:hypothetical protein
MKTQHLVLALQFAGLLHIGIVCAGLMMPRVVNLRAYLVALPPFIHRLFWVYYSFIGLCLISFGTITFFFADALAAGSAVARAWCAFLVAFWTLRLWVAAFVFDVRPYLTSGWRRAGYHATSIVFVYLPVVYGLAATQPVWLR